MPNDRELDATHNTEAVLTDHYPGMAAIDETILNLETDAISPDGEVLKRPFGPLFWVAIGWVSLIILLAILANLLPLQNPNYGNYNILNAGPSLQHWLGTDDLGRDLFSRIVFGSRVSLVVGFGATFISIVAGGTLGLLSGYKGGALDSTMNAASFIILAFPAIIAVIALVAVWAPPNLWKITLILGVGTIPLMYRVIRATTLAFANRDFVVAAKTMGATTPRILFREILPNVVPIGVTFGLISVAGLIVLEGSLAFLGLSVPLPTPSWGNMIAEGSNNGLLSINPLIMLWPALSMFLLLLSINLIGDRLRQRLDVREGLL